MRFLLPTVLILTLVGAIAIGLGAPEDDAEFTMIGRESINILDPAMMSYMQDIRMALTLWEGVTELDPETILPAEGSAYFPPEISENKLTYVFTIREDAKWSNGDPVTAHDYVRGWRRAIEPGTADVYAELINNHIKNAGAYSEWRHKHVALLSLMRQYQDEAPIKISTVRDVWLSDPGVALHEIVKQNAPELLRTGLLSSEDQSEEPPAKDDPIWNTVHQALSAAEVDWRGKADDHLDRHIIAMEERFKKVGFRSLDPQGRQLEMRLERPIAYMLDLSSFSTFMPVHESIEKLREHYEGRPLGRSGILAYDSQWTKPDYHKNGYPGLIGNGAFILEDWQFHRRMRIKKNPYYWDRENVKLESALFIDVNYANSAFMLYEQGHVDMLNSLSMDYTPELVAEVNAGRRNDIKAIPSFGTYYYSLNCRDTLWDDRPNPLADPRVRRALCRSVDRQSLVDHVVRLNNPISTTFIPRDQIPGYESPEGLHYDPDKAREELAAAGYPDGKDLPPIEFLYNTGQGHERAAQAIARMWKENLGIEITLVGKETKTFAEDRAAGRYQMSRSGWYGDYNDPTTFLDLYLSGNSHNTSSYSDPEYDDLLARASVENDTAKRSALLTEAERILVEEGSPILPLYTYVTVYAWRSRVKGIFPNSRLQFPIKAIYIEDR